MIINTGTVLAIRCSYCGKLNFHAVSLFAFSGKKSLCFDCDCTEGFLIISLVKPGRFVLKTGCGMCETEHAYYFKYKELFSAGAVPLKCLETGLEIGFVGAKEQVIAALNDQETTFSDLVEDVGYGKFFDNPEIMLQVIEHLNCLSEEGSLKCKCGNNNIDLDILPDRLEIVCNDCGNKGIVFAQNKNDLLALQAIGKIELTEQIQIIRSIDTFPISNG